MDDYDDDYDDNDWFSLSNKLLTNNNKGRLFPSEKLRAFLPEDFPRSFSDNFLDGKLGLQTPEDALLGPDLVLVLLVVRHRLHLQPGDLHTAPDHLPPGLVAPAELLLQLRTSHSRVGSPGLEWSGGLQ